MGNLTIDTENNECRSAAAVVSQRKTDIIKLLEGGISWRRLAYLLQLPEASCRRAILADPELADLKRPEGYASEIAFAESYAALKAKGYPIAEVRSWINARSAYDTSRAKNAFYRIKAKQANREELNHDIKRELWERFGPAPEMRRLDFTIDPEQRTWEEQREAAERELRNPGVTDFDQGF